MRFLKYSIVSVMLLLPQLIFAAEQLPLSVHINVTGLTQAGPPRIVGNYVLFTFPPENATRYVGIAFESDDFRTIHPFYRNQHGVFFYLYPLEGAKSSLVYRLVVDGLWRDDPENADTITDRAGILLSKLVIPLRTLQVTASPVVNQDGSVQFFFQAPPNQNVTIAGDFNNWDPFMNRMKQISNGLYSVTLRVAPGTHGYYFVSGGTPIADPLNPRVDFSAEGTKISVFSVP